MSLPQAFAHFVPLDAGKVWVAPDYLASLQQHGLTTFADFLEYSGGVQFKKNRYREVRRFELPGHQPLFIKRHFAWRPWEALLALVGLARQTPACQELTAIGYLQQANIATMKPVAFGESCNWAGLGPSFLVTEELSGAIKLEKFLEKYRQQWQENLALRRQVIAQVATLARTMHQQHLHHQDFYLGHILISRESSEQFALWLIDLQRMRHKRHLADRWRIKDLAQLYYASFEGYPITRSDRLRFWYDYCQRRTITAQDRQWLAAIERRKRKMDRHERSIEARKKREE